MTGDRGAPKSSASSFALRFSSCAMTRSASACLARLAAATAASSVVRGAGTLPAPRARMRAMAVSVIASEAMWWTRRARGENAAARDSSETLGTRARFCRARRRARIGLPVKYSTCFMSTSHLAHVRASSCCSTHTSAGESAWSLVPCPSLPLRPHPMVQQKPCSLATTNTCKGWMARDCEYRGSWLLALW